MAKEHKTDKKKTSPLVYVGIGCLVLIVFAGIGMAIVGKFFASKIASGMFGKAIESQTGIKTNIQDLEKGKMTFTDNKTGATVDVGSGKVPDTFPKDFPVYPGAMVTSSLSGGKPGEGSGFWLTLTTGDAAQKVADFYTKGFASGGWTIEATYTANDTTTQTVKKGSMSGNVSISREDEGTTQIVIVLGEDSN
jgi:hypothetical protein